MSNSRPKKIAFLFGSGVSIPAGMPKTHDITTRILSGENVFRHSNGNYYIGQPRYTDAGISDEYSPRILKFLEQLKLEIDRYYKDQPERQTNYEDIYYVASQIRDSGLGEYDNPVVQPFIDKILPRIQTLLVPKDNEVRQWDWQIYDLAYEATNYIQDIVWHLLSKQLNHLDYLRCITDVCHDKEVSNLDIFTLNHDTVLEQFLSQNGIQFTDGFGEPVNNVRYWNPDLFEQESSRVRLFKLHGSINWFMFRTKSGDRNAESIGIPLDPDIWHTKNQTGQMQWLVDARPIFLAGTFNKMLNYTSGIYEVLHYQLYRSLRQVNHLVICGYGFGDKGINTGIIEWIYSSITHRILVVHPEPGKLKIVARPAISNKWDDWVREKMLTIIQKKIEVTSWQELKGILLENIN